MTRVMDGVVRQGWVQPAPLRAPEVRTRRVMAPVSEANVVTGLDGIRRARPTLLEQAPKAPTIFQKPSLFLPKRRTMVAFGLIAIALVASGFTTIALNRGESPAATAAIENRSAAKTNQVPEASRANPSTVTSAQNLQGIVDTFAIGKESSFGIIVKDLKTGATASLNPDRSETSASLYKLFVAQQIFKNIDAGKMSYTQPAGSDTGRTIDECLALMINISDNGCGNALGSLLNWGSQDSSLKAFGYTGTTLSSPQQTSTHDVAMLLETIYDGKLNSVDSNSHLLSLLKDQHINNRLPLGLPSGTTIAHKTGDLDGFIHDAGIVYGPKTDYLVVVMGSPGTNYGQFADLSAKLWDHFEN